MKRILIFTLLLVNLIFVSFAQDTQAVFKELPAYMSVLLPWGCRQEFSNDGKEIYFLEKTCGGDAYKINIATKEISPVTTHFFHEGFNRILSTSTGDLLLCGNREFVASDPWKNRHHLEMWILDKSLNKEPVSLNEFCDEGPAVSKTSSKIAWTDFGQREIFMGDIVYANGIPSIQNKRLIISYRDSSDAIRLETQNFRPGNIEEELLYTHYYGTNSEPFYYSETYGYNLKTGKIINYTKLPYSYNECEGVFPDGKFCMIESDRENEKKNWRIDLFRLELDGSGKTERLTKINPKYSWAWLDNPVVSCDGKYIAIQMGIRSLPGGGKGIILFDVEKYERLKK